MINIITHEVPISEELKTKLEFICQFAKVKPMIINGSIKHIDKTNLSYIEPNKLIVNNHVFLIFNYSNDVYIGNLHHKIKICELKDYMLKCK